MIEYIPLVYWIGYIILFIGILFIGSLVLARDTENEKDLLDLLISLVVMPFFSWLLIFIVLLTIFFMYIEETKDE